MKFTLAALVVVGDGEGEGLGLGAGVGGVGVVAVEEGGIKISAARIPAAIAAALPEANFGPHPMLESFFNQRKDRGVKL